MYQGIAPEKANFFAGPETTYYIMVASFFGTPGGNGSITVDVGTPPASVDIAVDAVGRGTEVWNGPGKRHSFGRQRSIRSRCPYGSAAKVRTRRNYWGSNSFL